MATGAVPRPSSAAAKRIAAKVIFRLVDQYITARDLVHAKEEFKRACELDPFNLTITGYQQRLGALERELGRQTLLEEERQRIEGDAHARDQQLARSKRHQKRERFGAEDAPQNESFVETILAHVGELVTAKAWDRALREVRRGKKILPESKDLRALEERLLFLKEEDQRSRKIEETRQRLTGARALGDLTEARDQLNSIAKAKTSGIVRLIKHIEELVAIKAWNEALDEVEKAKLIDPQNSNIRSFEFLISLLKKEEEKQHGEFFVDRQSVRGEKAPDRGSYVQGIPTSPESGEATVHGNHHSIVNELWHRAYGQCLRQAWGDGIMSDEERNLLSILRNSFAIPESAHAKMELEAQWEVYLEAMVEAWRNGAMTPEESEHLALLRDRLHISADVHLKLDRKMRQIIHTRGPRARHQNNHDCEPLIQEQMLAAQSRR